MSQEPRTMTFIQRAVRDGGEKRALYSDCCNQMAQTLGYICYVKCKRKEYYYYYYNYASLKKQSGLVVITLLSLLLCSKV